MLTRASMPSTFTCPWPLAVSDFDARLVDLYGHDNPDGPDHAFYRSLADEYEAESLLDVGYGTGILAVAFAREGRAAL
jgi:2-polyprenyl-3-methyl-5-hydroxy-6-metoxy-1,4-benzoquinol methylase